jgi:TetR/AcrR family fatty acid metabolism transcriptional regulator
MQEFTDRQIEIMEAATNRISKYGIQNLTIKTLAEDIGLSEPALYRHFKSKNEILLSLLEYFQNGNEKSYSVYFF